MSDGITYFLRTVLMLYLNLVSHLYVVIYSRAVAGFGAADAGSILLWIRLRNIYKDPFCYGSGSVIFIRILPNLENGNPDKHIFSDPAPFQFTV